MHYALWFGWCRTCHKSKTDTRSVPAKKPATLPLLKDAFISEQLIVLMVYDTGRSYGIVFSMIITYSYC